jgi:DNA polymerase
MKGFILDSKDGLLSGDFSQIEARTLVSWAGQQDMIDAFIQKKDPYKLMATRIYAKPMETITKDERFMGKQSVLGCGYGIGRFGLANMLWTIYDIIISDEEGGEADRIVKAYRTSNKKVVALWYAVDRLAKQTILTQPQHLICATDVPRIAMRMVKKWLVIRLPSGRCLWYFDPELVPDERGMRILYEGRDIKKGGRWGTVDTYGGKLVENVTQAIARDVMADAMLRLDAAGFTVNLTIHDEIVAPGPKSRLDEFEAVMRQPPTWWPDLPIDVEVQHKRRFQK